MHTSVHASILRAARHLRPAGWLRGAGYRASELGGVKTALATRHRAPATHVHDVDLRRPTRVLPAVHARSGRGSTQTSAWAAQRSV
eukprot:124420-Rhodomonas_salina.2